MTGKAKKSHAPNLKKDDLVNAIDKLSQELKDLLKPCINTTEKTTANASDDYESCLRVLESRVTALEEENKQLKETLKMPTYAGVTAVAPQTEPAASDGVSSSYLLTTISTGRLLF